VGRGEDCDLGHLLGDVDDAGLALEAGIPLEVGLDLAGDDGNVGSEGLSREGNLHELRGAVLANESVGNRAYEGSCECTFFCSISLALGQS